MKPRNFPERINQRRKQALKTLATAWVSDETAARRIQQMVTLNARIVDSARDVRSKKRRAA